MFPPVLDRRQRTSGWGSPPTRHWNITELPITAVWFCGPRMRNGFTVAEMKREKEIIYFSKLISMLTGELTVNLQLCDFWFACVGHIFGNALITTVVRLLGILYQQIATIHETNPKASERKHTKGKKILKICRELCVRSDYILRKLCCSPWIFCCCCVWGNKF